MPSTARGHRRSAMAPPATPGRRGRGRRGWLCGRAGAGDPLTVDRQQVEGEERHMRPLRLAGRSAGCGPPRRARKDRPRPGSACRQRQHSAMWTHPAETGSSLIGGRFEHRRLPLRADRSYAPPRVMPRRTLAANIRLEVRAAGRLLLWTQRKGTGDVADGVVTRHAGSGGAAGRARNDDVTVGRRRSCPQPTPCRGYQHDRFR
jgi:hypothetical protein